MDSLTIFEGFRWIPRDFQEGLKDSVGFSVDSLDCLGIFRDFGGFLDHSEGSLSMKLPQLTSLTDWLINQGHRLCYSVNQGAPASFAYANEPQRPRIAVSCQSRK